MLLVISIHGYNTDSGNLVNKGGTRSTRRRMRRREGGREGWNTEVRWALSQVTCGRRQVTKLPQKVSKKFEYFTVLMFYNKRAGQLFLTFYFPTKWNFFFYNKRAH